MEKSEINYSIKGDMSLIKERIDSYEPLALDTNFKASVIILLVEINGEENIIFEKRSKYISQPGEVSLPGGKVEKGESFCDAALREANEEIGVDTKNIDILGEIDYLVSSDGLIIKTFVGKVNNYDINNFKPNMEIESLFAVPISYFIKNPPTIYDSCAQLNFAKEFPFDLIPNGKEYKFSKIEHKVYFYEDLQPIIWGYTARIISRFIEIITKGKGE